MTTGALQCEQLIRFCGPCGGLHPPHPYERTDRVCFPPTRRVRSSFLRVDVVSRVRHATVAFVRAVVTAWFAFVPCSLALGVDSWMDPTHGGSVRPHVHVLPSSVAHGPLGTVDRRGDDATHGGNGGCGFIPFLFLHQLVSILSLLDWGPPSFYTLGSSPSPSIRGSVLFRWYLRSKVHSSFPSYPLWLGVPLWVSQWDGRDTTSRSNHRRSIHEDQCSTKRFVWTANVDARDRDGSNRWDRCIDRTTCVRDVTKASCLVLDAIHPSIPRTSTNPPTERRGDLHTRRLLQTHVPHPRGNEAQHRHTHPPRPSRSSTRTHTRSSRKKRKTNKQTRIAPDTKTRRSKTPAKTVGSEPRRSRQTQQKKTSVELAPEDPPNTQPKDNDEETRERRRR